MVCARLNWTARGSPPCWATCASSWASRCSPAGTVRCVAVRCKEDVRSYGDCICAEAVANRPAVLSSWTRITSVSIPKRVCASCCHRSGST
jgi:hypothetical protein